jgi:hypothetical protein
MFDQLKPSALGDNAMLYKDLTQWLRNKTFLGLFFGLLLLSEGISIFVSSLPTDAGKAGPVVFNLLLMVLSFYGLIIAFSGYNLTSKEFQNRTFELYELSGMSLEKMIRGKFLSMIAQFLFGFFCIVPFLFFSYLLGGLDFYTILGVLILAAILVPRFFFFRWLWLCTANESRRWPLCFAWERSFSSSGWVGCCWFSCCSLRCGEGAVLFSTWGGSSRRFWPAGKIR